MRPTLLLTITLLLIIPVLFLRPAQTREQEQQCETGLPNLADYPPAGPNCKKKVKLAPWHGQPDIPNTNPLLSRCRLSFAICGGVTKCYQSEGRIAGAGFCDDFSAMYDALLNREICCDKPPEKNCATPIPWFDASSGCKELKTSQLMISGGTATLYVCGYPVFYAYRILEENERNYRIAMKDHLVQSGISRVCCDKFRQAVETGRPCNPKVDVDCDGIPNKSDFTKLDFFGSGGVSGDFPVIDGGIFKTPSMYNYDSVPEDLHFDQLLPPDQCKCGKWELLDGDLKCNPDPTKRHSYKATWKCSSTEAVVESVKVSKPGARCL